jgi:hypothetical protein
MRLDYGYLGDSASIVASRHYSAALNSSLSSEQRATLTGTHSREEQMQRKPTEDADGDPNAEI